MSDRELLELAAKAAGIELRWYSHMMRNGVPIWPEVAHIGDEVWNPLTDDGDAFTLMVALRLEPRFIDNSHSGGAEPSRVTLHLVPGIVENIKVDVLAATRRAIVRAAAEIGRNRND